MSKHSLAKESVYSTLHLSDVLKLTEIIYLVPILTVHITICLNTPKTYTHVKTTTNSFILYSSLGFNFYS